MISGCDSESLMTPTPLCPCMCWMSSSNFERNWAVEMSWMWRVYPSPFSTARPPRDVPRCEW